MHFPLNGKILELAKVIGVVLLKHRNGVAGTSDVDSLQSGIEFDDVSSRSRREVGNRFVSIKIEDGHPVIDFALKKRAMMFRIERHAVIAFALSYRITRCNFVRRRIDHGEEVLVLEIDVDLARHGIVLRHSGLALKAKSIDDLVFSYVYYRHCAPALV